METVNLLLIYIAVGFCFLQVFGISVLENNSPKNTITEDERRGAPVENHKVESEKNTRGAYSSASHKHQHYYYPSEYDSHAAATGHGGGYSSSLGGTTGYEYGGHSGHSSHSVNSGHNHHSSSGFGSGTGYGYNAVGYSGGSHGGHDAPHGGGHSGHGGHGGGVYGGHGGYNSALALKGLLIPLAGIALLGAAAALTTNPVLLQLGVLNGRRRRRSIQEKYNEYYPTNPHVKPQ